MNMKAVIKTITPELAEQMLSTSKGNPRWRSAGKIVDDRAVDAIYRDIISGKWNPGNASIAFDEDGHLVDGHHRLKAISKAGIPVDSVVVYGVTEEGQKHIDENKKRTISQSTGISNAVVSMANLDAYIRFGQEFRTSNEYVVEWYEQNPDCKDAIEICKAGGGKLTNRSSFYLSVYFATKWGADPESLKEFIYIVNTGLYGSKEKTSAAVVRNCILEKKIESFSKRVENIKLCSIVQRAIFDFQNKTPRTKNYSDNRKMIYYDALKALRLI